MQISRRAMLARGATMLAGLYFVGSADAATVGVSYRLRTSPHCSCKACHHHAANRLFATRTAAARGRAHPGCKCTIVRSRALPPVQWQALFGHPRKLRHSTADRRWASTKRALKLTAHAKNTVKPGSRASQLAPAAKTELGS